MQLMPLAPVGEELTDVVFQWISPQTALSRLQQHSNRPLVKGAGIWSTQSGTEGAGHAWNSIVGSPQAHCVWYWRRTTHRTLSPLIFEPMQ